MDRKVSNFKPRKFWVFVDQNPRLKELFFDHETIGKFGKEIEIVLSDLFPKHLQLNEIKAATIPFDPTPFNRTKRMVNIMNDAGDNYIIEVAKVDMPLMFLFGCLRVLGEFYGKNISIHRPWNYSIPNLKTGITHHYRVLFNADFIKLEVKGKLHEITDAQIEELHNDHINFAKWKKIIKPENFIFKGIGLMSLVDITEQESMSLLKGLLLVGESNVGIKKLEDIEFHVRNIFKLPEVNDGFYSL